MRPGRFSSTVVAAALTAAVMLSGTVIAAPGTHEARPATEWRRVVSIRWPGPGNDPTGPDADRAKRLLNKQLKYFLSGTPSCNGSQTQCCYDYAPGQSRCLRVYDPNWPAPGLQVEPPYSQDSYGSYPLYHLYNGALAEAIAVAVKTGAYDATLVGRTPQQAKAAVINMLTKAVNEHCAITSNVEPCWQVVPGAADSATRAVVTEYLGTAAWLMWDEPVMTQDLREKVARVLINDANRITSEGGPFYEYDINGHENPAYLGNSQVEEMAVVGIVQSLAYNMMPNHPDAVRWAISAVNHMLASAGRVADAQSDTTIYHGYPVGGRNPSRWLHGGNVQGYYHVINHGIIHPGYTTTVGSNWLSALYFSLSGRQAPRAAFYNGPRVYYGFSDRSDFPPPYQRRPVYSQDIVNHPRDIYYPQGNDWGDVASVVSAVWFDMQARALNVDSLSTQARKARLWESIHARHLVELQDRQDGTPDEGATYRMESYSDNPSRDYFLDWLAVESYGTQWLGKWVVSKGLYRGTHNEPYPKR